MRGEYKRNIYANSHARAKCRANLRAIGGSKATWALEHHKVASETPQSSDLFGDILYMKSRPVCSAGGTCLQLSMRSSINKDRSVSVRNAPVNPAPQQDPVPIAVRQSPIDQLKAAFFRCEGGPVRRRLPQIVSRANENLRRRNFVRHGYQIGGQSITVFICPHSGGKTQRLQVVAACALLRSPFRLAPGNNAANKNNNRHNSNNTDDVATAHGGNA